MSESKVEQYKGWEIAKMINENTLKEGSMLKDENQEIYLVKNETLVKAHPCSHDPKEVGASFLTDKLTSYVILQRRTTVEELLKSNKRCMLKHKKYRIITEFNHFHYILKTIALCTNYDLQVLIRDGEWYVEE